MSCSGPLPYLGADDPWLKAAALQAPRLGGPGREMLSVPSLLGRDRHVFECFTLKNTQLSLKETGAFTNVQQPAAGWRSPAGGQDVLGPREHLIDILQSCVGLPLPPAAPHPD